MKNEDSDVLVCVWLRKNAGQIVYNYMISFYGILYTVSPRIGWKCIPKKIHPIWNPPIGDYYLLVTGRNCLKNHPIARNSLLNHPIWGIYFIEI